MKRKTTSFGQPTSLIAYDSLNNPAQRHSIVSSKISMTSR